MSNFKNREDLINLSLDIVFLTYLSTQNYINLDLYNQLLLSKIKKKTNQNKIKFAITNLIINLQQYLSNYSQPNLLFLAIYYFGKKAEIYYSFKVNN